MTSDKDCCPPAFPILPASVFPLQLSFFPPSVNLVLIQLFLTGAQAAVLAGLASAGRETHWYFLLLVFHFSLFSEQLS